MAKVLFVTLASALVVGCGAEPGRIDETPTPYQEHAKVDLLRGELPPPLQSAADLDNQGAVFDLNTQRVLYNYGVTHPADARPWLLLAHDAVRSETYSFVVRYYHRAIEADPRAAQQDGLLEDVLDVVRSCGGLTEQREASELVDSSYGFSAVEAVNDQIVLAIAQHDAVGAERLHALLEQLDVRPRDAVRAAPSCFAKPCVDEAR